MVKIAIIEDDELIGQMYRMKFEVENFDTELAIDGVSGLDLIENYNPDLVLLDLQMPEMNGDEVLRNMRKKDWGKDIPVIILTNTGKEEAPKDLGDYNIHSYIVKAEMTPRDVVAKVKEALNIKD